MINKQTKEKGFTLVEVLIAAAIFVLFVSVMVALIVDVYTSQRASEEYTEATFLAHEGLEAARAIRDFNWANLTNGPHGLVLSGGVWTFSGTSDSLGNFTRQITVTEIDPHRKQVTSQVTWPITPVRTGDVTLDTYLTNWWESVSVGVNWCSPSPQLLGTYNTPGASDGLDIFVVGTTAYLVTANNATGAEFYVLDVTNPAAPSLLGSLNLGATANAVFVSGNYAYVASASNSQELQIVNITNPASPSLVGSYNAPGNVDANDVFISGSNAYLVRENYFLGAEFYIVNVAVPAAPSLLGSLNLGADANNVNVSGNYAYVASASNSQELQIINVSVPALPSLAGSYNAPGTADALSLDIVGTTVYLGRAASAADADFFLIDVTNPALPSLIGSYEAGANTTINGVKVSSADNLAFLATGEVAEEFKVVDISTPASPAYLCGLNLAGEAADLYFLDNKIYIANFDNNEELEILGPSP